MTRVWEGGLLVGATALAGFGVVLVNLARGGGFDLQVGVTVLVFGLAFGILYWSVIRWAPNASPLLLPCAALLAALGFAEIYRLSPERAGLQRWWLLIAALLGSALLYLYDRLGLEPLRRYRSILIAAAGVLLLLPMLPSSGPLPIHGVELNGSRLWVRIEFGFTEMFFQPGEISKLLFVVFLASYLADQALFGLPPSRRAPVLEMRRLAPLLLVWAGSVAVLVLQRDLGASVLFLVVFVAMLFAATGRRRYPLIGLGLMLAGSVVAYFVFDHVRRRFVAWLRPFANYEDEGYQIAQAWFGMASGSLSGSGLGLGRPDFIPQAETDFIFAALGEELGFAGVAALLAAFTLLVAAGLGIALRCRDPFRKLLTGGLSILLGLQAFLIIGGVLRVLPITGLPLPFTAYGGSALVAAFLLLVTIARASHEEAT